MSTFKYNGDDPLEIGGEVQLRVSPGQTIELPDAYDAQFDADPRFASSRVKNPDVTTGTIPVQQPTEPAPAA